MPATRYPFPPLVRMWGEQGVRRQGVVFWYIYRVDPLNILPMKSWKCEYANGSDKISPSNPIQWLTAQACQIGRLAFEILAQTEQISPELRMETIVLPRPNPTGSDPLGRVKAIWVILCLTPRTIKQPLAGTLIAFLAGRWKLDI